jgi:hypothetical protein
MRFSYRRNVFTEPLPTNGSTRYNIITYFVLSFFIYISLMSENYNSKQKMVVRKYSEVFLVRGVQNLSQNTVYNAEQRKFCVAPLFGDMHYFKL